MKTNASHWRVLIVLEEWSMLSTGVRVGTSTSETIPAVHWKPCASLAAEGLIEVGDWDGTRHWATLTPAGRAFLAEQRAS